MSKVYLFVYLLFYLFIYLLNLLIVKQHESIKNTVKALWKH